MKKLFFAAMAATILFASCAKDNEAPDVPVQEPQTSITATFNGDYLSTRAFFDDTAIPEPWENKINNLRIYIFDEAGNWAETYEATAQQIAAGKLDFTIPSRLSARQVTFYAVANHFIFNNPSQSSMDSASDGDTQYYNGDNNGDHTSSSKYANYTMSAKYSTVMPIYGEQASIHFDLKRAAAKIAVRMKLHPQFLERYPDHKFILTSCGIFYFIDRGFVMEPDQEKISYLSGAARYSREIILSTDDTVGFLFYAGASGKLVPEETRRPGISIHGKLVAPDGSERIVYISVPFNPVNDSEVRRNGYYRLDLSVTGIGGTDVESTLKVDDWGEGVTAIKNVGY